MLNRRTLRIKIMQSLFAFEQCKDADYLLALDHIDESFKPDLNSMKVQDKELLKGQRTVALELFQKRFKEQATAENPDPRIEEVVHQALGQYQRQVTKDFEHFRKSIVVEVETITQYYFGVLNLVPALASAAEADKKVSSANFSSNPVVKAIRNNAELNEAQLGKKTNWSTKMDLVRGWYRDCLKPDKEFNQYLEKNSPSIDEHKSWIKHLVRKVILGPTAINAWFEEEDLHWTEDHEIVRSLVDKTLKSLDESTAELDLQKLSLDWEEDKIFIEKLFRGAAHLQPSYRDLIARNTRNWEVDRLPLTDRVILQMAIAELLEFPNIPVKVTINEYIELAKQYSTPKSRQFVNGILDVIARELKESGKIRKSGRGLVDNK